MLQQGEHWPSLRVMVRPLQSDMLSHRTISRALRHGEHEALIRGAHGRILHWWQEGPFRWTLTVYNPHHHLRKHNHSFTLVTGADRVTKNGRKKRSCVHNSAENT